VKRDALELDRGGRREDEAIAALDDDAADRAAVRERSGWRGRRLVQQHLRARATMAARPLRRPERHDGHVTVEARHLRGLRELDVDGRATGHQRLRPGVLLHRLRGLDPRPARAAPAVAVVDADRHPEPGGLGERPADHAEPLRRGEHDSRDPEVAAREQSDVQDGGLHDALGPHHLEVFRDALGGNGAVHPVPPHVHAGVARRGAEALGRQLAGVGLRGRSRPLGAG
jgi:hypothetical protein